MENGYTNNNMKKKKSNNSGLSILEALVSTAVVGIGFIAILQMTNFSIQSIDNSGERTKANYLTENFFISSLIMRLEINDRSNLNE